MDSIAEIRRLVERVGPLLAHRFDVITALDDGTQIPPEALSEDHSIGLYGDTVPCKMRENLDGYRQIEVADLRPQQIAAVGPTGVRADWLLEAPGLRGVRFRSERLQYLDEGWWAATAEVHYPAHTVLALVHAIRDLYGTAYVALNTELPMPLWIAPSPLGAAPSGAQAVVQARGEGRVLPTNIHTECPMEYARRWASAARSYYRLADPGV